MKNPKLKINNKKLSKYVSKAQNGDKSALEYIVSETSGYVYYYCLSMLRDDEKAKDAAQDIYVKVMNNLASVENPRLFLGWLKKVTANHCKNLYAKKQVEEELVDTFEERDIQYIPEQSVESAEVCEIIRGIIDELPIVQRESILLYYYQQLSIREIAEILEIKEGTVKSRLYTARKAIGEKLKKYGKHNLLSGLSPLSYISYSLISEAEKYKCGFEQSFVFALHTTKPALSFSKTALPAKAASLSFASKAAAVACAGVIAVGGLGTYFALNQNNDKVTATADSVLPDKISSHNAVNKAKKHLKVSQKADFSDTQVYYVKKKNRVGFTASFNNYNNFKYTKNPIWVVVNDSTYDNFKEKLIPRKGTTNNELWEQIVDIAKEKKYAWRDKNGDVWVKYERHKILTFVEIDAKNGKYLGQFEAVFDKQYDKTERYFDEELFDDLKLDFKYAYKKELKINFAVM